MAADEEQTQSAGDASRPGESKHRFEPLSETKRAPISASTMLAQTVACERVKVGLARVASLFSGIPVLFRLRLDGVSVVWLSPAQRAGGGGAPPAARVPGLGPRALLRPGAPHAQRALHAARRAHQLALVRTGARSRPSSAKSFHSSRPRFSRFVKYPAPLAERAEVRYSKACRHATIAIVVSRMIANRGRREP